MKIYTTQQEVENDIKDGVLAIKGDVTFECSISIKESIVVTDGNIITARYITARDINAGDITAWDITARNINARYINARDITAFDINAWNINARDINARDINAWDINAWDINAWDINAWDINALDITAVDIRYYAFCSVYDSINCVSIKSTRDNHSEPVCLDGKLTIRNEV